MGHTSSNMPSSTSYPNLDQKYVEEIRAHFGESHGELKKSEFMSWQRSLGDLAAVFFEAVSTKGSLKSDAFLEASSKLRGDADDVAEMLIKIHGSSKEVLRAVVNRFAQQRNASNGDALLNYFLKDLPSENNRFSNYLISNSLAASIIQSAYAPLWNSDGSQILPKLNQKSSIITSDCSLAVLNAQLPMERRHLWSLLFSSVQHGSSFSQLQKRICGEGPCLVVIQSTEGNIFGCFASEGFLSGPQYRGDATSFLFTLNPEINVFSASGKTDKFAYLNVQQETLPNGLGIGGSEDVWPLFVSEEYGKGICCKTVAFEGLPCLAGQEVFQIKDMEVWRVGLKRELTVDEEERIRSNKSIIDKDPGAKALLEMSGKTMHSEAYREPAPMLDDEDQWHK